MSNGGQQQAGVVPGPGSPKIDWRTRKTWFCFLADALYCGIIGGLITAVSSLMAGRLTNLDVDRFAGWALVLSFAIALTSVHLYVFYKWLLPDDTARLVDWRYWGHGFLGGLIGALNVSSGLAIGMGLIALVDVFVPVPGSPVVHLIGVLIASSANEEALLKLLFYRAAPAAD